VNKKLLIFGCGYTARALGKLLRDKGWILFGVIRSEDKSNSLLEEGIKPILWNSFGEIEEIISGGCSLLNSIPPVGNTDLVYERFSTIIIKLASKINWFGYLSATSVYGDKEEIFHAKRMG